MKSVITLALIFVAFQAVTSVPSDVGLCDRGRYYSYADKGCVYCPAGTWSNGTVALTKCEPCAPGYVAGDRGTYECGICPVGKYEKDRQGCYTCPYSQTSRRASSGEESCGICQRGAITTTGYQKDCEFCPAGTFEVERKNCSSCPPGMISEEGSSECVACPAGSIAVNNGTMCLPCPAGTRDVNRTTCELCPAGTFGENDKCTACPAGWITPSAGSTICTRCQAGTYEYNKVSCFQCAAGTFGTDGVSCRKCPSMTISAAGSGTCTQCSSGTTAVKGNTRCQDESGNETGAQQTTTTVTNSGSGNNASSSDPILYVLAFGVICALLFVGVSVKNKKLESELQRDRLLYQQS